MRPHVALTLGAALVGLAGCLPAGDDDPPAPPPQTGPGRQLDQTEAEMALPITADLPSDIQVEDNPYAREVAEQRAEPKHCLDASFAGDDAKALKDKEAVRVIRHYTHESWTGSASVTIRSYTVEVPDSLFDKAGQAVGSCSTMTRYTLYEGDTFEQEDEVSTNGLSVPHVGDRTYAGRFTITDSSDATTIGTEIDYLAFKRGHNLVTIVYAVGTRSTRAPGMSAKLAAVVDRNLQEG